MTLRGVLNTQVEWLFLLIKELLRWLDRGRHLGFTRWSRLKDQFVGFQSLVYVASRLQFTALDKVPCPQLLRGRNRPREARLNRCFDFVMDIALQQHIIDVILLKLEVFLILLILLSLPLGFRE